MRGFTTGVGSKANIGVPPLTQLSYMSTWPKTVRVSDPAKQDLARIGARTQHQWGKAQKTKYLGHIRDTFELLRNSPDAGKPRDDISPGLRSHPARRHVIFYREKKTVVEIVRVLHAAMDPDRHL